MSLDSSHPGARLAFLEQMLLQDPANALLLADAAEAALAAGELASAERLVGRGLELEPAGSAWRFRLANVRIAQGRLDEAREILLALQAASGAHPAISHNLAFIAYRQGRSEEAATLLAPWIESAAEHGPGDSTQALWLRAMQHAGRLEEAWAWASARVGGALPREAGAVASLIAFDLNKLDEAERLASSVLSQGPAPAEAELAHAGVLMARGRLEQAAQVLQALVDREPHQARAWSTLGYAGLLRLDAPRSRAAFERALAIAADETGTLLGLGWACMLAADPDAASDAFRRAAAADPESPDAQGGLAIVAAMQGSAEEAKRHATQSRRLQPGSLAARYAESIISGNARGLHKADEVARRWLAEHLRPPGSGS